jgi:hypothetical protein
LIVQSRFEKSLTRSLGFRVDDQLYARLAKFGKDKDLSVSEAVRALVEVGLDHSECQR